MIHPRDHTLCLAAQLRSDMIDPTKVQIKVRVNGGAPTTYTSVSSPAVTQAQDCNFGYHLELPANSFADGNRVSRTVLYNGIAYSYGDTIIGPATVDGSSYAATVAAAVWSAVSRTLTGTVFASRRPSGDIEQPRPGGL